MRIAVAAIAAAILLTAGCRYPRDVEGTLDRVEGGTMRVGLIEDPPWVELGGGEPRGLEPALVRGFADELGAEIEWVEGTEAELMAALAGFQLDLVIGGLTRSSPYAREVALTRPYIDTEIEVGVPPGTELPGGDLGGERIQVERNSEAAALLKQEEEDAIQVPFDRLAQVDGPALLDTYEIDALDYELTDYILRDDEHAMAVAMGENGFLVELENFLLDRGNEAERMLHRLAESELEPRGER